MAEDPDPERLLAEALRAQAARTPLASTNTGSTNTGAGTAPTYDREFELLSGSEPGYGLLAGREVDTPTDRAYVEQPRTAATTRLPAGPEPIRVWWALLLALLLGLAAGAVIGLLTLL